MEPTDRKTAELPELTDAEKLAAAEAANASLYTQLRETRDELATVRQQRDDEKTDHTDTKTQLAAAEQKSTDEVERRESVEQQLRNTQTDLQVSQHRERDLRDNRVWDIGITAVVTFLATSILIFATLMGRTNTVPQDALIANQIGLATVTGRLYATEHERDHLIAANSDLQSKLASSAAQAAQTAASASKGNIIVNALPGYQAEFDPSSGNPTWIGPNVDATRAYLDALRATGTLSGSINLNCGANSTNAPAADTTNSIWLGSFDSGAFDAASISEIRVRNTPQNGKPGQFSYELPYAGERQAVHYMNAHALIDNQTGQPVTVPGRYRVVNRGLFTTGSTTGETTQVGNVSQLFVQYLGQ